MAGNPRLVFPRVQWAELLVIISFLSERELYTCGCLCRAGYVNIYLREKNRRNSTRINTSRLLSRNLLHEKVALVSYPRSGNSFLRRLLEERTGITTGSDSRTNRTLSASLLRCGFDGEGIVDSSVWIVKSHFPERMGYLQFQANRILLLVRNPWDAIESYFHMGLTNTHDKSLTDEVFNSLNSLWKECMKNEAQVWKNFHEYWLKLAADVPTLVVRYEDLLNDRETTMQEIWAFLIAGKPPLGHSRFAAQYCTNNIISTCSSPINNSSISSNNDTPSTTIKYNNNSNSNTTDAVTSPGYAVKKGGVGKSLRRMEAGDVEAIASTTSYLLNEFGYYLSPTNTSSSTASSTSIPSSTESGNSLSLDDITFSATNKSNNNSNSNINNSSSNSNNRNSVSSVGEYSVSFIDHHQWLADNATNKSTITNSSKNSSKVTSGDSVKVSVEQKSITINENFNLRTPDDRFGRYFTEVRRKLTNNDKEPFPTATNHSK